MSASDEAHRIAQKVAAANGRVYLGVAVLSSVVTASLCCGLAGLAWALWR